MKKLILVVAAVLMAGCGSGHHDEPSVDMVTFGEVRWSQSLPESGVTTIWEYLTDEQIVSTTKRGGEDKGWVRPLNGEFDSIKQIIEKFDLNKDAIVLPKLEMPDWCLSSIKNIYIRDSHTLHHIYIGEGFCNNDQLPDGYRELMNEKDRIIKLGPRE